MTSSPGRAIIGAALVFALALFAFGRAFVRAIIVDTGNVEQLPAFAPIEPVDPDGPPLTGDALMLAVESDPFQPDRTRPAERYRLPGEEEPPPLPEAPPPPPAPEFRLGGTVVFEDGGMALIGLGDEERLVNVGEAVGGYRLRGVNAREAVLENPFGIVTLEVAGPPQTVAAEVEDDDDDRRRGQRGRSSEERQQLIQQRQMMQQLLQRARQGGASAEQVEMIQRMMQGGASPAEMMRTMERLMRGGDTEFEAVPERVIRRRSPQAPRPPGGRAPSPTR
jgi:hypothetical protein